MKAILVSSIITYLIYKRFEPASSIVHFIFFLGLPTFLHAWRSPPKVDSPSITTIYLSYWASLLVFVISYRLSPFHPLARFPGPLLARVSKFWMAYVTFRGDAHNTIRDMHTQYGDVVRIGPNELSFCGPEAILPILGIKAMKKGPYYDTRKQKEGHATMDGLRDFSEHAARRKPWSKGMSTAALRGYSGVLVSKVQELIGSLAKGRGESIDISAWMTYFGFDFMGAMTFGHEFGMMQSGTDVGGLWHTIESGTTIAAYISQVPWIFPILMSIPGADKEMRKMQALGKQCAEQRVEAGSSAKDLFYYLTKDETLKSSKTASGAGDGLLAVIAGSDTAATALTHIWYFLLRNPTCLSRLRKEVDESFPDEHDIFDFSKQADMPYLNACINEAMRLYPPVLSGLQRTVEPGGHTICGHFVPENTKVSVHVYTMHRDEREFSPVPDVFWPERWLDQDQYTLPSGDMVSKDQVVTNRGSYLPFSYGPQNCAGKGLAIMEVRAVVCAMMQAFDIRAANQHGFELNNWEKTIEDVYVTNRGSLFVNITARH